MIYREVRGNDFTKEPNFGVPFNFINSSISTSFPQYNSSGLQKSLWDLIQQYLAFEDCVVFKFTPPSEIDPFVDALYEK